MYKILKAILENRNVRKKITEQNCRRDSQLHFKLSFGGVNIFCGQKREAMLGIIEPRPH